MADRLFRKFLQETQFFLVERAGWRHDNTLTGMDAQRIDVFHAGHREAVVVFIADYFEFDLFPSFERFLDQNLRGVRERIFSPGFEFIHVVAETAAHTAQYVGRAYHDREADLLGGLDRLVHRVDCDAARRFDLDFVQLLDEQVAVFGVHDCFYGSTQYLDTVFFQDTVLIQLGAAVQCGLASKSEQNAVGTLFFDHFLDKISVQRQEVNPVGDTFRGLDGCHIGVDQDGGNPLLFHRF